jgi:hypothetical protein
MHYNKIKYFMFLGVILAFSACSESPEQKKQQATQDSLSGEMVKTQRRIDSLRNINDSLKLELRKLDLENLAENP